MNWSPLGMQTHSDTKMLTPNEEKKLNVYNLLVAVVVESVIAAKCSKGSKPNGIRKEDLSASIDPHLNK